MDTSISKLAMIFQQESQPTILLEILQVDFMLCY